MTLMAVPGGAVLLAIVVVGVALVECLLASRRLARAMVRWAARLTYPNNPERAGNRAREWDSDVTCARRKIRALFHALALTTPALLNTVVRAFKIGIKVMIVSGDASFNVGTRVRAHRRSTPRRRAGDRSDR
jgi:hypothetical protein